MTVPGRLPSPVVSVIVPAFNAEAFLAEAVGSALAQTLRDIEVIIIDDASGDGTLRLALALAESDERIRAVSLSSNSGAATARNLGIALARGEWIAVLDSDDRYHPDRLRHLLVHAENRGADMVADDLRLMGEDRYVRGARRLHGQIAKAERIELDGYLRRTATWGRARDLGFLKPIFRTALLRSLPYVYDEALRVGEDDELVVRLLLAGARYQLLPEQLYHYRQHGGSISRRLSLEQLEAMVAAAQRQAVQIAAQAPGSSRAAQRRLRVRQRALAFERIAASLKHRQLFPALAEFVRNPGIVPMFAAPLRKRLAMLAGPAELKPGIE